MTPDHLKAIAGWSLLKRDRDPAYSRLSEAAGEVADIEARGTPREVHSQAPANTQCIAVKEAAGDGPVIAVSAINLALPRSCEEGGDHKFAIQTQRCVFCGRTYREVRSRDPELMR